MENKTSVKLSKTGIDFLKKLCTNRRKMGVDEKDVSYWRLLELIATYFKSYNNCYIKLIKMEIKNV